MGIGTLSVIRNGAKVVASDFGQTGTKDFGLDGAEGFRLVVAKNFVLAGAEGFRLVAAKNFVLAGAEGFGLAGDEGFRLAGAEGFGQAVARYILTIDFRLSLNQIKDMLVV